VTPHRFYFIYLTTMALRELVLCRFHVIQLWPQRLHQLRNMAGTSKGLENEWYSLMGPSDGEESESHLVVAGQTQLP
jgi:hypothetical protein